MIEYMFPLGTQIFFLLKLTLKAKLAFSCSFSPKRDFVLQDQVQTANEIYKYSKKYGNVRNCRL